MPQPVILQTDIVSPVNNKKAAAKAENVEQEAFSSHFNKQIQQDEPPARASTNSGKTEPSAAPEAANKAEADKDIAADGNNLPSEKDDEITASKQTDEADESAEVPNDKEKVAAPEPDESAEVPNDKEKAAAPESDEPVALATEQTDIAIAAESTDKPIRAQVTVSQQAVDNARAAPVEMTARTHPAQTASHPTVKTDQPLTGAEAEDTAKTTQKTATSNAQITAQVSTSVGQAAYSTDTDIRQDNKNPTPNLAVALKELEQAERKAPKLRADILDALQRHQGKEEVTTNLRNLMSLQAQQAGTKAASNIPLILTDRALPDAGPLNLNSATTLSGLVPVGQSGPQSSAVAQPAVSLPVQPNMQNPAWSQVMSSRVVWMAKEGVQQAELRMSPANLGPVEVRLHVQNDQASVTFLAQNAATRDALEQALPRLRESFAESGMELANAQVGEQQQQEHREQSEQTGDSHIFAQASLQDDDIEDETGETVSSGEASVGLSLYA